jgi:hypothetical protein
VLLLMVFTYRFSDSCVLSFLDRFGFQIKFTE